MAQVAAPAPDAATTARAVEPLAAARDALRHWRLDDAQRLLAARAPADERVAREVLRARLDLMRGRQVEVIGRLEPLVAKHPEAWEARVVLGRALQQTGARARAVAVLDAMADDYNAGRELRPADLVWLGVGLELTGYFRNANQVFRDALAADPGLQVARLRWAALFLEKYNFRDADRLYAEVLEGRPDEPEALLGRARVDILSDGDLAAARGRIERVLAGAPEHARAHALMALVDLHAERPLEAARRLETQTLRVAPRDPEGLALLGAAAFLADDDARFRDAERRALAINPRCAAFYTTVSEIAERAHRYDEAIALDRKAIALDPEHWRAYGNLGTGYSRVGDDARAREFLEKAYQGDPYDVRTYNLLELFYDRAIGDFEWVEAAPVRLRLHRTERAVLERYMPQLLREAYTHLARKYRFEPEAPLHVEIFPDPELFSVRSVGLPRLGAHGICFGHVITARSPSAGDFNWGEVLWHETSHVFHLQMSRSRVPRWFTEGLAVYETTEGRPAWRREMDGAILDYLDGGRLRGIGDFNQAFTQARSRQDVLVAYAHAALVAEFITRTFGAAAVRAMLLAWGERKSTPEVFAECLGGGELATFDERFRGWLDARLAPLRRSFALRLGRYAGDARRWVEAADAAPASATAQAEAAQALWVAGDRAGAARYVDRALNAEASCPQALLLRAMIAMTGGLAAAARADLEALVAAGHDGAAVRQLLADAARVDGKPEEVIEHLQRAVAATPDDARLVHALVEALAAAGREVEAYAWRRRQAELDQDDVALADALLAGAERFGASREDVLRWGERGNHVAPMSARHHVRFATELERLGLRERARFEAHSALLVEPGNADARRILGR